MADIQSPQPWTLLYTDNVLLTNEEHQTLNDQVQQWKDRLNENGLQLNLKKAEYMECGPQTISTTIVDDQELKKVDCIKYLGSTLSADGDRLLDSHARQRLVKMAPSRESPICDRRLPIHLKAKIYKTAVWPVALYGSQCWPASTKHQQALHSMEMRMLRWSLGLTRLDQVMNEDVQ